VVLGIDVTLGLVPADACPAYDAGGNGSVTVDKLERAVHSALDGCP